LFDLVLNEMSIILEKSFFTLVTILIFSFLAGSWYISIFREPDFILQFILNKNSSISKSILAFLSLTFPSNNFPISSANSNSYQTCNFYPCNTFIIGEKYFFLKHENDQRKILKRIQA